MSLDESSLEADVASRLFKPSPNQDARTIGAELELIPLIAETHEPALILGGKGPAVADMIRLAAKGRDWDEQSNGSEMPSWNLPDGSRISFEPGGQIEISSKPHESCSELIAFLGTTVSMLTDAATRSGVELIALGVDPYNDVSAVPLQLGTERYVRMSRYFEQRGQSGIRMMRQTAALQMNIEHGSRPLERWKLLNALAPYVLALFANSSSYAGRDTGHQSYRSHLWRTLDGSRTGIPYDAINPARRYSQFALDAGSIRAGGETGAFHRFRDLLHSPDLSLDDWSFHLSTLFPEVRPKEYFELRSADTIPARDLAAPLTFITGLVYDSSAADAAVGVAGEPDANLLERAGRAGLTDETVRSRAAELVRLAMEGASALGESYMTLDDRARAADWFDRRLNSFHTDA